MNYSLALTILLALISSVLAYISLTYNGTKGKVRLVFLSVLSFLITVVLIYLKNKEDEKMEKRYQIAEQRYKKSEAHDARVESELNKMGLGINHLGDSIVVRSDSTLFAYLDRWLKNQMPVVARSLHNIPDGSSKSTESVQTYTPLPSTPVPIEEKPVAEKPVPISISAMEKGSCQDQTKDQKYSRVCFVNKTGVDLSLVKYLGYWIAPVTNEQQAVPNDRNTCTGRLLIDYLHSADNERDFSFYFSTEEGKLCRFPYRITLKACSQYTVTLTKADLGLK